MNLITQKQKPVQQISSNSPDLKTLVNKELLRDLITTFFINTDKRQWAALKNSYDKKVLIDYTSMTGGNPARMTPEQIIASWKALLPGFDKTHHQIGNIFIYLSDKSARITCYATINHYLQHTTSKDSLWTLIGDYDFHLRNLSGEWKINKIQFNLCFAHGNENLPKLAQKRLIQL